MARPMDETIITTMCAIVNERGEALFVDRRKKWPGLAFPGGHIEGAESLMDCVKREVLEETGLTLHSAQFRGVTHFYGEDNRERYFVFHFYTEDFSGEALTECPEGRIVWIPLHELAHHEFAGGMAERFPMFFGENAQEFYIQWNDTNNRVRTKLEPLNRPKGAIPDERKTSSK